jgi:ankyrin repeat protein
MLYNVPHMQGGCTPLHLTAQRGHLECMRLLVDRGAEVNAADKVTAHSNTLLVDRGAEVNAADERRPCHD